MSSAAEILVIIVSVVLSIFLIVGIILAIYLIRLSAEIRRIAQSTQQTVSSLGDAVQGVIKMTSPVILAKTVGQFVKKYTKRSRKGE
ncbi:hypothetical protein B7Y94_06065 [Candidatus Saccharibacteria bacterium 32-49-12]|nr:MAG: hypothetical protein B7Y94_06065 [Candidatus Saccharibacteria bacterium 32-49-12]